MEKLEKKIFEKIEFIIADFFSDDSDNKPEVKLVSNLRQELKFDELAFIELVIWLENEFEIEITDDNIDEFITIQDITTHINS